MEEQFETIMDKVCGLCHWPYVYQDEKNLYSERCDYCPAAAAVQAALSGKEAERYANGSQ